MPAGRPSDYTEELAEEICQRVAEGMAIKDIGLQDDMPAARTIHRWMFKHSEFGQMYARARKERGHALFEEALALADKCPVDDKDATPAYKLKVETRKWAAGRLNAEHYGDRQQLDINGTLRTAPDEQLESRLAQLFGKAGSDSAARGAGETPGEEAT